MDKSEMDFLQECQNELAVLKERVAQLENRLAAWQEKASEAPAEADEVDFTGVELGVAEAVAEPAEEPVVVPEPEDVPMEEKMAGPVGRDEAPVVAPEPEEEPVAEPAPAPVQPAPDTLKYAWRGDNPGLPVKNIRSGISLLDRALFIGTLFKEDFALYDSTIAELNNMNSLDEAVAHIQAHFPQWNLGSDVVYRFMMAIRRKLG